MQAGVKGVEKQRSTATPGRKAEATRTALLDAARHVIARDGYVNARIADIAHEAGKSVGVFYSYFKDKTEIFAALVDAFHEDLKRTTPAPGDYEENTAVAVKSAIGVFWTTSRQFHPEMLGLLETAFSDPTLLGVWRRIRVRSIRRFAFRIRKQQELGRCQGLNPEMAASALHGMLEFTCFNWHSQMLDYPDAPLNDAKAIDTLYALIARVLELDDIPEGADTTAAAATSPRTKVILPAKAKKATKTSKTPGASVKVPAKVSKTAKTVGTAASAARPRKTGSTKAARS